MQLGGVGVHRDDAARPSQVGPVDGRHTDPPATDHGHRFTHGHFGSVHRRAESRDDAATDHRRPIEGHVFANLDQRIFVHQHLFGEGREIQEGVQLRLFGPFVTIGLPRRHLHIGIEAKIGTAGIAVFAHATKHRKAGHDVVARLNVSDFRAYLFDDPS